MKMWYRVRFERQGFWFFKPYAGHQPIYAESVNEAYSSVAVPNGWKITDISPYNIDEQIILDKLQKLDTLKQQVRAKNETGI